MLAFVFAAWEVSFGLWLQTQLHSKADFEGYRETSPPQLNLPSQSMSTAPAEGVGRIPSAQVIHQIQLLSDTGITVA